MDVNMDNTRVLPALHGIKTTEAMHDASIHASTTILTPLSYDTWLGSRLTWSPVKVDTYPEGGWRAWSVVLGAWLALFSSLGLLSSIATFHTYLLSHQLANFSSGDVGWIFSVYTFICFGGGVFIGPIFDKYGPRVLILVGTVCLVTGLMLLSFCHGPPPVSVWLIFG